MQHLFAIVAATVLVAGAWLVFDGPGLKDACATSYAAGVLWEETFYAAAGELPAGRRAARRLGTGRRPGDCGGYRTDVYAVSGLPEAVAVATGPRTGPRELQVATGFPLESREHPLHSTLVGRRPARTGPCGARTSFLGVVTNPPGLAERFLVRTRGGRERDVTLRASVAIPDHRRAGLPYLREGDRVVVTARRCEGLSEDYGPGLYATAIRRPMPPYRR